MNYLFVFIVFLALGSSFPKRRGNGHRYACNFNILLNTTTLEICNSLPTSPQLVWSHINGLPELDTLPQPRYPVHAIAELDSARINFQAGALFDQQGCISSHVFKAQDWPQRLKYLRRHALSPLKVNNRTTYQHQAAFFFWGSMFARDWQHAVIDFLPMYSHAIKLILANPSIPIIAGPYIRFFENMFPFNQSRYIYRDYLYKNQGGGIPDVMTFKKVYFVDILFRQQSYVIPGVYDKLLPFLTSDYHHNAATANAWRQALLSEPTPSTELCASNSSLRKERTVAEKVASGINYVVYLDRSQLINDTTYVKSSGLVNGRNVLNQQELLQSIERSLRPEYQLVVWGCRDWRADREVLAKAVVVLGPHGGHFTNIIFAPRGCHVIEFGRSSLLRQLRNSTEIEVNGRWVFAGLSNALGHHHWMVEDMVSVSEYKKLKTKPKWSDDAMLVDPRQVLDTLRRIGVAA